MLWSWRTLLKANAVGIAALSASLVNAAVPVEESLDTAARARAAQASQQPAQSGAPGGVDGGQLFYQLQVLQEEVRELRGIVEEQAHQLNRLQRDHKERYIDIDRRLSLLSRGDTSTPSLPPNRVPPADRSSTPSEDRISRTADVGAAPSGSVNADSQPQPAASTSSTSTAQTSTVAPVSGTEREVYSTAFESMKARRFDQSIGQFQQLINAYPNGQYTPNAYYWLGELYLAQSDTELARQSFVQVINLYPKHQKVSDALYKLGVVYHRLGDNQQALKFLDRVRMEHPDTSAAGLANTYAAELR